MDFEDYKNCLEAIQLANKINYLKNNKTDVLQNIIHNT